MAAPASRAEPAAGLQLPMRRNEGPLLKQARKGSAACVALFICAYACAHSILTLTSLHLLAFLKSDTFSPSRWDRRDSGHMTAALPICRLDPRQFEHRTRRLRMQSGGLRGAFLTAFRKTRWRGADCDAYWLGVLYSVLHFIVGFLCAATNIRALRTYRKIPHGLRTSHFGLLWCRGGEVAPNFLPMLLDVVACLL